MKHDKRITEILNSKEFKGIKSISDTVREKCRKETSRYMFFYNKNAEDGTCERCGTTTHFEKTKHKTKMICPHCKHEMIVEHTWRKQGCDYNMDWLMDIKAISDEVVVLRYIMIHQFMSYDKEIGEVAREVFDFKTAKQYKLALHTVTGDGGNHWEKEWVCDNNYFIEHNMGWYPRKAWCQSAGFIFTKNRLFKELSKIKALQYTDWQERIGTYYLLSDDLVRLLAAPLHEKMAKVGLKDMAEQDFEYRWISFDAKQKSLVKMLRLDKKHYNLFMENPTFNNLSFLQMYRKIPEADYRWLRDNMEFNDYHELRRLKAAHPITIIKYIIRKKVNRRDYYDYLRTMKVLGYDLSDKSYTMPSDFKKADDRVQEEMRKKKEEERAKADAERLKQLQKRDGAIKEISDALRAMPNLKDFLGGSRGFLVYVPDSAEDILREGRNQHNCVGSYVDRIAQKKTLVFFIRKLDCPDASFVTMEYCNGEVIQARYDHNIDVFTGKDSCGKQVMDIDNNLVDFTNALAEILRKNKVMIA